MYSANDVIGMYMRFWHGTHDGQNSSPVKFILESRLKSQRKIFTPEAQEMLHVVLEDLTVNAMQAISSMDCNPTDIMKRWNPPSPGTITYREL